MITIETYNGAMYASCIAALRQDIFRRREHNANEDPLRVRVYAPIGRNVYVDAFIRMRDLYVIGVENRQCAFYFNDFDVIKRHSDQRMLSFSGQYGNLGKYAQIKSLSSAAIDSSIHAIAKWTKAGAISNRGLPGPRGERLPTTEAKCLLSLILLTSEAVRFRKVWSTIAKAFDGIPIGESALKEIDELVRDWAKISRSPHWYKELDFRN